MKLFEKLKTKNIMQTTFFDEYSFNLINREATSKCDPWNEQTVPFLQDVCLLTSVNDLSKVIKISHMEMADCYKYLLDNYLNVHGRGAYNIHKFYETVVSYNLGYWNKDGKTVTYTKSLLPFPGGNHEDLCMLYQDEETLDIKVRFDSESLRKRMTYTLKGESLKGYERAEKLCQALQELTHFKMFGINELVYMDEAGKWKVRNDIPFSRLVEAGQ